MHLAKLSFVLTHQRPNSFFLLVFAVKLKREFCRLPNHKRGPHRNLKIAIKEIEI